ncbi:RNA polymerase subunit sigma-70 [Nocardioides bizhenqiangii]|uniref:RNA polymerase sigma factor n=1 Tax=Nocardioides bizhenqiangii TaxID=3095076 RepID=A0ABZ0ZQC2_9ACTN|nr:RNA polymerase subunit sigma-70 [Nocardioides sp. HM61]WQQ26151.1 RNA polymerase subunit sigma-70 [Nocardioides sp. HM61]
METTEDRPTGPTGADEAEFMSVARTGDAGGFAMLTERYRRELLVHCYRILASYEDAQDLTQETFLRAWAKRESFQGRASLRTWLYRIATNACLDFLEKRRDRTPVPIELQGAGGSGTEVLYLQPWPGSQPEDPHERAVAKETVELAFIVAVQHLPARQRAVLILRDVLGWPAQRAADTLDLTLASANSALQRARATLREHLPDGRLDWSVRAKDDMSAEERKLVSAYVRAHETLDIDGLTALLRADLRFAMPPQPGVWVGRDETVRGWIEGGFGQGDYTDWRCLTTTANGQPAIAMYLRRPGSPTYEAFAMDVLRIEDGLVAEITTFEGDVFEWFGLPSLLEPR